MHSQKSIVVLPFENISSDTENEYFADGVTEEIINALSKVEGLKVTARTSSFSYKNKPKDIRLIGNELGVSTALEGSIRKSGSRIRVTAQLIRTDDGFHVWSENFDRDLTDIFELQDEISLLIADKIRENFGHLEINEHLVTTQTRDVDAYAHFLKGRYFQLRWNVDDFDKAIQEYEKSIILDPGFYQPYFGLVQCFGLSASWGFAEDAETALEKAGYYLNAGLKINEKTPEAHFALATKSLWIEWKPYAALKHLEQALSINPNDTESLEAAAEAHIALGRFEEASNYIQKALEVNPLSANHHFTLGNIHYLQGAYPKALECFERSLQIDPKWDLSLQVSACCHVLLGNQEALDHLLQDHPDLTDGHLFMQLFKAIQKGVFINIDTLSKPSDVYFPWSLWTLIYADRKEKAFEHLVSRIEKKQGQYLNFKWEPLNDPLRSLEEYQILIQKVFDQPFEDPIRENNKSAVLMSEEDQVNYRVKLEQLMLEEHLYSTVSLTLRDLASEMDLHANKLSWLINEAMGKNFNEYINGLRIEAFKQKVLAPEFNHYSILGIAYECGFSSKSVFNDFFKKSEGITPSAWVKEQKGG